jgi:predicted nucleotidyltransferase
MNLDMAIKVLREAIPDLVAVYLYGSEATSEARPDSDVDLAVLAGNSMPAAKQFDLRQDIESLLHRDVDLVDMRMASTVLRMQVISTGTCLFAGDEARRQQFEDFVYSSYARLNEERREILSDIAAQGRVYG